MNSYLLYKPNGTLRAFTTASELQLQTSDPRDKIIQNVKILPINQNNDLSSQLNHTRQHKSKGMLSFQNKALDIKLLKITQIETIRLTSKNMIFNRSSFSIYETAIGFMLLKRIRKWSQFLILSPG